MLIDELLFQITLKDSLVEAMEDRIRTVENSILTYRDHTKGLIEQHENFRIEAMLYEEELESDLAIAKRETKAAKRKGRKRLVRGTLGGILVGSVGTLLLIK